MVISSGRRGEGTYPVACFSLGEQIPRFIPRSEGVLPFLHVFEIF